MYETHQKRHIQRVNRRAAYIKNRRVLDKKYNFKEYYKFLKFVKIYLLHTNKVVVKTNAVLF